MIPHRHNQRMNRPPPRLVEAAVVSATDVFDRVLVLNDPEGVTDPFPPSPPFVDLLPSSRGFPT
jgi:hypothetical protein